MEGGHSPTGAAQATAAPTGVFPVVDFGSSTTEDDHERTQPMSTREPLIKARLGALALAQELENIRLAPSTPASARASSAESRQPTRSTPPQDSLRNPSANPECLAKLHRNWRSAFSR